MNIKLGYYKVGYQIFFNKLQAILYANAKKQDIEWHFNDEILNMMDWSDEPISGLVDIYKSRAKQIREQYDYLILMASGGADSTNILYTFLNNDIKIDEVVAAAPLSGMKNFVINPAITSPDNTISETILTQIPLLDYIHKKNPNIKITINDYFEDILNMKTDEWIYESSAHWIHFSGATRHSLDKFTHIKNMAEAGKKIGVIYGIDKPIICRGESGNLYTVIADSVVNVPVPHFKDRYPNVETVLFYYSPDMPELMIKQAHEVCKWMYKPENGHARAVLWDRSKSDKFNKNTQRGSKWQRVIIPCIYPELSDRFNVWQADKQGLGFKGGFEIDDWILKLYPSEKFVQMVQSDLRLLVNSIDIKYCDSNNKEDGFLRFIKYWKIGHESQWVQKI